MIHHHAAPAKQHSQAPIAKTRLLLCQLYQPLAQRLVARSVALKSICRSWNQCQLAGPAHARREVRHQMRGVLPSYFALRPQTRELYPFF